MDVEVRTAAWADARSLARVEAEAWRDAYATLLPERVLVHGFDAGRRARVWRHRLASAERARIVVAADGPGQVVGYATHGPARLGTRAAGQVYELYVLPERQNQGLGRRLWTAATAGLAAAGLGSVCVEVLDGNPSRYFYEALGGRLAARGTHVFAGHRLPTLIYVWAASPA